MEFHTADSILFVKESILETWFFILVSTDYPDPLWESYIVVQKAPRMSCVPAPCPHLNPLFHGMPLFGCTTFPCTRPKANPKPPHIIQISRRWKQGLTLIIPYSLYIPAPLCRLGIMGVPPYHTCSLAHPGLKLPWGGGGGVIINNTLGFSQSRLISCFWETFI